MSYDLMVFEKTKAPKDRKLFMSWYIKLTKWDEGHSYDNPEICSDALKSWFMEMKEIFPQMNGPYSLDENIIDNDENIENHVTDYSIAKDAIYASFVWSFAEEAYSQTVILAKKHGVGFFDVSSEDLTIAFPDTDEMDILEKKAWFGVWHEKKEYQKIIDAINAIPEDKLDYDTIVMKAVTYNNTKEYDKAIETIMSISHEIEHDAHPNYVLGYAYYYQKKYKECIKAVEKSIELDEWEKENMDILAFSYYYIGKKEKANEIIHEYMELKIDDDDYLHVVEAVLEYPKEGRDEWMEEKLKEAYQKLAKKGKDKETVDILAYYSINLRAESLQMLKDYASQKIKEGEHKKAKKAILEYPEEARDDEIKKLLKMCE